MEDIDRELYGDPPEPDEINPGDVQKALSLAAAHARRIVWLVAKSADLAAMYAAERERLEAGFLETVGPISDEVQRRKRSIEMIHRAHVKVVGKTLKLPTGPPSKLTGTQPELVVEDEDALRVWAEESTLLTVLWPPKAPPAATLSRSALKTVAKLVVKMEPGAEAPGVTAAGEFVPGVKYVARHDHWNYGKAEK